MADTIAQINRWVHGDLGQPGAASRLDHIEKSAASTNIALGCVEARVDTIEKNEIDTKHALNRMVELMEEQKQYRIDREAREKEKKDQTWLRRNWGVAVLTLAVAIFATLIQTFVVNDKTEEITRTVVKVLQEGGGK